MLENYAKLIEPLSRKISSIIGLGLIKFVYKSSNLQEIQAKMLEEELRDKLRHYMSYGLSYHPHPDAECLVLFPCGDKTEGLVIAVNDQRYHLPVEQGEVAIYDDLEQKVHLTRDGIQVTTKLNVNIDSPTSTFSGDVRIKGRLDVAQGASIQNVEFIKHGHKEVKKGSDNSGEVNH